MYSIGNALTQAPDKMKNTVLAVLGALVVIGVIEASGEEVAAVGIAVERVLDLLYAAPLKKKNEEAHTLRAIDFGKQIAVAEAHP